MKIMWSIVVALLVLSLGGCATGRLGAAPEVADTAVHIVDNRTQEDKQRHRESVLYPLVILGDDAFDVSPVTHLKYALSNHRLASGPSIELVISKFAIADWFPQRFSSAVSSGLAGALSAQGFAYYPHAMYGSDDKDSVICTLEGTLNGKDVKVSSRKLYMISKYAGMVRAQPEWIAAVRESISECASLAAAQAR